MSQRTGSTPRTDRDRVADHAAIGRLADDLLPALVAKLAASGLAELEVREGDWHVRLRMPVPDAASAPPPARRAGAPVRQGSGGPGTAAPPRAAATGGQGATAPAPPAPADGSWDALPTAGGGRAPIAGPDRAPDEHAPRPRAAATSPAVGIFRPRDGVAVGSRVRAGDRLGFVDVLGVPHDVVSPADGVVGGRYVEAGEGVEYGQELVRIELAEEPARTRDDVAATSPAASEEPA